MEKKFYYKKGPVIFNFIVAFGFLTALIVLFTKPLNVVALIFLSGLVVIVGQLIYNIVKSFIQMTTVRPAIILTDKEFIDNINGVKISWTEINAIDLKSYWSGPFLVFDIKNKSAVYRQMINPIQILLYRFESIVSGIIFKINISNVDVQKEDILKEINNRIKK